MADADILKEYLIEVGVRADTGALSKFANIISVIERMTVSLTAAMGAGVLAIEGLVYVATSELEDLYWATKRLKSSAGDIQDFQLRMQKAGSSANDARESMETLAAFRRTNPFGDQFLGLMGIDARGKGTVQVMDSLIVRFKQLTQQGQYWLAVKWGEQLGLDERQVWSMVQTSAKAEHVYNDMYKRLGINQKQALQNAHDYQNRLRDFNAELLVVTQSLGLKFLPVANKFLDWLASPGAERMGQGLYRLAGAIGTIAANGAGMLAGMPAEALEFGIVGFFLFGRKGALLLGMLGAASSLLDKMSGDKGAARPDKEKEAGESRRWDRAMARWFNDNGLGYLNSNDFNATYEEYKRQKAEADKKKVPVNKLLPKGQEPYSEGFGVGAGQPGDKNFKPAPEQPATSAPPNGKLPLGVRNNNPGNLQPGGKETIYDTVEHGLSDMAKLLLRYGRQGLNTIDSIINKYAPEFDKNGNRINDTKQYQQRVSKDLGVDRNAALNLSDPSVLQRLMAAMIRVEQGYAPYSQSLIAGAVRGVLGVGPAQAAQKPGIPPARLPDTLGKGSNTSLSGTPLAPAAGAGAKNVTINQKTDITIHGAKDPKETAKQVKRISDRTNGDLVRNFSPALR